MFHFNDLPSVIEGKVIQCTEDTPITTLLVDSRKIVINTGSLFFASRGKRNNGHNYILELYSKGIRQFVIEVADPAFIDKIPEANIFLVPNSLKALQELASAHRINFKIPIIAITGSNGKTIIKEWLSQMLSLHYKVVKSPKSYNSQLGVPLSIWQINEEHEIGVFEAGLSNYGEMEVLEKIIKPNIGIFSNIGTAHDQNFASTSDKVKEKAKLFKNCDKIIYCKDHELINLHLQEVIDDPGRLVSWSALGEGNFNVMSIIKAGKNTTIELLYNENREFIDIPFNNDASIENCLHCIVCLISLGFKVQDIQRALNTLSGVSMRLELKEGINNCYIVDDSYNNDLVGLEIALDFLLQQKQKNKKTLILSDLLQSGLKDHVLYQKIAALIKQKGIDKFIGIGEALQSHSKYFPSASEFFSTTGAYIQAFKKENFHDELILIKGARSFCFENIVNLIEYKHHGTVLEIDLDALIHNLNFYRSKLKPQTRIMVMVKAFAYGSGSYEVANLLQYHRVDYLAVAYTDEGVSLRENGIHIPIMVMNPSPNTYEKLLAYNLEPEIYSLKTLKSFIKFIQVHKRKVKIHLKLDTGMHRLGFEENELEDALPLIKENDLIEVASVFSHLSGADEDAHHVFTISQVEKFTNMSSTIENYLNKKLVKHILNSAGILRYPEYQFDMARLGIGLYGIEVNNLFQHELLPISTLKTTISQIKNVKKGTTIGYSRKGVAKSDITIATIAIGYADGFSRSFSNGNAIVLIKGKEAPVIGNVCMDMTMVDITGIDAEEGDEVIVFGKELPLHIQAKRSNEFPYEILTNISERVKRVFFAE